MRRFEYRLLVYLLPVVAATLTIVLMVVFFATKTRLIEDSRTALEVTERNLYELLQSRSSKLQGASTALARDPAFRSAVARGDRLAMLAALEAQRDRAGASRLLFIDLDGRIRLDTAGRRNHNHEFWAGLQAAAGGAPVTAFAALNAHPSQVALVPVLAPDPIGWIGVTQEITPADLKGFLSRSTLPVNLSVASYLPGLGWQLFGTTLDRETRPDAQALLAAAQIEGTGPSPQTLSLGRRTFVAVVSELPGTGGEPRLVTLLQYSVDEALLPYEPLFLFLLGVGALALFGVLVGLLLIARRMTRPIRELDAAAQRIQAGEYDRPVSIEGRDELARLGSTFNGMMEAIATREQRILDQTLHDAATGLPNLENFRRQLDSRLAAGESFAVLLFELVGLDEVRNTLGHELAEQVVTSAVSRVAASCKRGDVIARLAGRTFGMCLPGATAANAESVAHRVIGCLADPITLGDVKIDVFAQAGIAACPEHARDAVKLLRHAEVALAETSPLDHCAIYDPKADPYDPALLSRVGELRAGLGRGEFELYYQPKVDLQSHHVVGAEALVRWHHPEHGLLLPSEFVPLAERTGVIQEVTRWAVAEAIARASAWCQAGHDLGVAVNLSAKDLRDPGLSAYVGAQLRRAGLPSARLTLEITESAFIERPDDAGLVLGALRDLGVLIAVDDFGTGYSSLAYLRRLPVSELKLDRSFVREVARNASDRTIARTIIDLGRDLGLSVTAEGVEDAECIAALREMGCPVAQGYYFSPPVPAAQFEQLLRTEPWRAGAKVKAFPGHGLPSAG